MTHTEFVMLVSQMRTAQASYFRERSPQWLNKARDLERQVDQALSEYASGQGNLFEEGEGG